MQTLTTTKDIASQVEGAVDSSPYLAGCGFSVETDADRVVLRGMVRSYYHKQMAQETLLRIDGVQSVENHLQVAT